MSAHLFDELTRGQLRDRTGHLVVIPLGATEQHGDALPVMTDATIVTHLAREAARLAGEQIDVLVAPTVQVGISLHHLPFGGTLTLSSETFIRVLVDLVTGLRAQGFSRTLFLNGHGGNDSAMRVAVERLAAEAAPGQSSTGLSYWAAADALEGGDYPVPGHAGGFETSAMLALRPELVGPVAAGRARTQPLATDLIPAIHDVRPDVWKESGGVTDDAAGASADAGAAALGRLAHGLATLIVDQVRRLDDRSARVERDRSPKQGDPS